MDMPMTFCKKASSVSAPMTVIMPLAFASSNPMRRTPWKMSMRPICSATAAACCGGSCAPSDQYTL